MRLATSAASPFHKAHPTYQSVSDNTHLHEVIPHQNGMVLTQVAMIFIFRHTWLAIAIDCQGVEAFRGHSKHRIDKLR